MAEAIKYLTLTLICVWAFRWVVHPEFHSQSGSIYLLVQEGWLCAQLS